jgi:hypothetical protein
MNFLKVAELRYILFSIILLIVVSGCTNSVDFKRLVFSKCKILIDGKLFSGTYEKTDLNNHLIIGKVKKGILIKTEEFINPNEVARLKVFNSCGKGFEKIFTSEGDLSWEGNFENYKRVGIWRFYTKDSIYKIEY